MKPSEIIVLGSNGQLGKELVKIYPEARAVDKTELDLTDYKATAAFNWSDTKVIINAAAYTNVDGAESSQGRVDAWKINATAVANLAKIAISHKIILVHISTDYVFNGQNQNHREDEPLSPLSVYGQSKAAGDIAASMASQHYIIRTSWVMGEGKNFVKTIVELANNGISPTVVTDQIGRPTFTETIVEAIDFLLRENAPFGTYNLSNEGNPVSWADLARKTFELAGFKNTKVLDISTKAYYKERQNVAPRPLNSLLDLSKIESLGYKPIDWELSLNRYLRTECTS